MADGSSHTSADTDNVISLPRNDAVMEKPDPTIENALAVPVSNEVVAVAPPARPRRSGRRTVLFALLPAVLIIGGYFYATGGQVMSSDNAYIQADTVGVSTDVSGTVQSIEVRDNEQVKQGQVLFRLDPEVYNIALAGAKAQLGVVRNQILNLEASYKQSLAEITQAEADLPFFQTTLKRQQDLNASSFASKATYDQAKHDLDAAQQKVDVAKAEAAATLAQLGGDAEQKPEQNPSYLQAQSNVDNAQRNLDHTIVHAPFDGIVTNVSALQVGAHLDASKAGFSLVSNARMWIAASPKETELTYVRVGQKVNIDVDTYPDDHWTGTVTSISPASGSSFSLLPAQNTTGNWVKVVQRIPMLVSIDDMQGKPPLRVGMSTMVGVGTDHARGLPTFIENLFGMSGSKKNG